MESPILSFFSAVPFGLSFSRSVFSLPLVSPSFKNFLCAPLIALRKMVCDLKVQRVCTDVKVSTDLGLNCQRVGW